MSNTFGSTHTPLISVLMTSYQCEQFISHAIESVLNSTFKDFELIVVDDCSTDQTYSIAMEYADNPKVRVYQNLNNIGDYPNRNKAAEYARGRYLKYLDSDDIIYNHGLDVFAQAMLSNPQCEFGLSLPGDNRIPFPAMLSPHMTYHEYFIRNNPIFDRSPTHAIFSRKVFEESGGFQSKRHISDTEFWLRLSAKHGLLQIQDGLCWSRMHRNQESTIKCKARIENAHAYFQLKFSKLTDQGCPLKQPLLSMAACYQHRKYQKWVMTVIMKGTVRQIAQAKHLYCSLSFKELYCEEFNKEATLLKRIKRRTLYLLRNVQNRLK